MRDVIKTGICVLVVMLILVIIFFIIGNVKKVEELFTRTKLSMDDPDVVLLYDMVDGNPDIRKAELINVNLTSDEIIEFTIDNIKEDDYKKKTVYTDKIACRVTNKVSFYTDKSKCNIRIINFDVFDAYKTKYFNNNSELNHKDFKYKGYYCKVDGKKYYCLYSSYNDSVLGYSVFDSSYKTKDELVIREYYLQINLKNKDRCLNYFNNEYCNDYKDKDKPSLSDKVIKEEGVLYEHVFKKNGEEYYLEKSFVVSEG